MQNEVTAEFDRQQALILAGKIVVGVVVGVIFGTVIGPIALAIIIGLATGH